MKMATQYNIRTKRVLNLFVFSRKICLLENIVVPLHTFIGGPYKDVGLDKMAD